MNIAAYDHGGGQIAEKLKKAVKELTKQFPEGEVILKILWEWEIGGLNNFSIAIVHPGSETEWEDLITNSAPGKVRIRVSTDPLNAPTVSCKQNGVYVLNLLKKAPDVSEAEWKCILEGIQKKDILEELLQGGNPQGLRPYFIKDSEPVILVALSILCQGYLAVHAEYKEQNKDWKNQDIAHALEQMGWNSVDKSLIPRRLGKKEKIEKVRNPGWWWTVFETDIENKKDLLAGIEKEWDMSSDKEISKQLEDLIRLIVEENEVKPAKMVARAYLALVEKLGV